MKNKLKLSQVKIDSFITSLNANHKKTIVGENGAVQVGYYSNPGGGCLSQAESMCCDTDHRLCPETGPSPCTHAPTGCTPNGSQCANNQYQIVQ